MKAEILGLWCVLTVANIIGLSDVAIFGDSRVTIKWARGEYALNNIPLFYWCSRIKVLLQQFENLTLDHIYRQFNSMADALSKEAYSRAEGVICWEEHFESMMVDSGLVQIYDI